MWLIFSFLFLISILSSPKCSPLFSILLPLSGQFGISGNQGLLPSLNGSQEDLLGVSQQRLGDRAKRWTQILSSSIGRFPQSGFWAEQFLHGGIVWDSIVLAAASELFCHGILDSSAADCPQPFPLTSALKQKLPHSLQG